MTATVFSTPRLLHRYLEMADEALFCSLYTDAETMRFVGPPLSIERAARGFRAALRLTHKSKPASLFFAMIDAHTAAPVGISSLLQIDLPGRRLEAGILILGDYRAQGLAKEELSGLLHYAFAAFPIDEVWVQSAVDHTIAEKLVMSVGLKRGAEVAADGYRLPNRIWSARRGSWPVNLTAIHSGESNVECP